MPSASTITAILHRHGRIAAAAGAGHKPFERFERAAPNELWQMDYKGHFATRAGRCHPLTVVDDHSRYAVGLRACGDERGGTVQAELTAIFRRYGLPERMLMDNGSPWGSDALHRHTWLTVWLLELGVAVSHGRPYHPQTQGKDERFHRTLTAEVIGRRAFADLAECQRRFDAWRVVYNTQRPHEALELATPAARYCPSRRRFPEKIEPFDYGPEAIVRRVDEDGWLSFRNRPLKLGRAFAHHRVALRPTDQDGCFDVLFCAHKVGAARSARGGAVSGSPRRSPRWVHRDLPRRPLAARLVAALASARVPPVDYRDELRPCQPVHHVPEHLSTISPAFTHCGRGCRAQRGG